VHGHAGQPVAGDEVARDLVVVGRGARGGVGEQDTGAFALEAVVGDHVVHDGVVVHARDVRLPLAADRHRVSLLDASVFLGR